MLAKENEGMSTAVEEMDKINQSAQERYLYLRREMAVSDLASHRAYWEKKGEARGEEYMLQLACYMVSDGKSADIPKLKEDHKFLEEMIQKYHLK
ncbi:MAG: hypothetical protein RR678_10170 [Lachnospiraceae bacterium]